MQPSRRVDAHRLLRLVDAADEVIALFDADLRHVFVNAAVERATGRPCSEFIGKSNRELGMSPALCDQWEDAIRRVFSSGETVRSSFEYPSGSGIVHFESTLHPEIDAGEIVGVISLARDVTLRVLAERALANSEERLRLALSAANAMAWEWNLETYEFTWSADGQRLYGFDDATPPDYVAWRQRIHPEDRRLAAEAFDSVASGSKEQYRCEFRIVHPERGVRWLVDLGRVIRNCHGPHLCMAGITLDVTERKEAEDARRAVETFKDEFIATLAHELRNALAPIISASTLLEMNLGAQDRNKAQRILVRQARHMNALLSDLGDLSGIKRGRLPLVRTRVDLRSTLEQALEQAQPGIAKLKHRLQVELPEHELPYDGDARRLVQVFSNLILNAVKYTPPGGHLRVRAVGDGDGGATIHVEDDGIGIDPVHQSRVFEMFTQVKPAAGEGAVAGFGIGLALVKRIVELHGGKVVVRSDGRGAGSTFSVTLPPPGRS